MQLSPTPEQQDILDAVGRFCREQVTAERLLAWEREPRRIETGGWISAGRDVPGLLPVGRRHVRVYRAARWNKHESHC